MFPRLDRDDLDSGRWQVKSNWLKGDAVKLAADHVIEIAKASFPAPHVLNLVTVTRTNQPAIQHYHRDIDLGAMNVHCTAFVNLNAQRGKDVASRWIPGSTSGSPENWSPQTFC